MTEEFQSETVLVCTIPAGAVDEKDMPAPDTAWRIPMTSQNNVCESCLTRVSTWVIDVGTCDNWFFVCAGCLPERFNIGGNRER